MTFVYIAYGQILDHDGHPAVFGGEYQACSATAQEAKFVNGLWLKVVCGYSSNRRNFSIIRLLPAQEDQKLLIYPKG